MTISQVDLESLQEVFVVQKEASDGLPVDLGVTIDAFRECSWYRYARAVINHLFRRSTKGLIDLFERVVESVPFDTPPTDESELLRLVETKQNIAAVLSSRDEGEAKAWVAEKMGL